MVEDHHEVLVMLILTLLEVELVQVIVLPFLIKLMLRTQIE